MNKIKNRMEFAQLFPRQYEYLLRNNIELLNELLPKYHTKWTEKLIMTDAKKCKTRKEWKTKFPNSYSASTRIMGTDYYCKHMIKRLTKWTLNMCKEDALKYKTKKEWSENSYNALQASVNNGWYEECTKHMIENCYIKKIINLDTKKIYTNMTLASNSVNKNKSSLHRAIKFKGKCGGYRWAYCDENGNILKDEG